MTSSTAAKITIAAYAVGLAAIIYSGRSKPFQTNYKRVWGLSLLTIGGALLSDIAPRAVGPYMVLVALVFLLAPSTGFGSLFKGATSAAAGGTVNPPAGPQGPSQGG
jgi:hypothetical protein